MTSYNAVCLLVLLSTVATKKDTSTWSPWCKTGADCKCEVVRGQNWLTCTHQNITLTPINGFGFPVGTQVVNLSYNLLHVLRDFAFNQFDENDDRGLGNLLTLNFSRNSIQRVAVNAFKFVNNLTILDLSRNRIERLSPGTFENMANLRELYLHYNKIKKLEEFTFKGLNRLIILDLGYCQISQISWWAFSFSNSPILLNMKNNNLTTFHPNYIYSPESFHGGINLANNPIICDCELERFYKDTYAIVGKYNLTCSGPDNYHNLHLTGLIPNDFAACNSTLITSIDRKVEGIASETTTFSCQTIPSLLFKNWTIALKVDGQDVSVWPDRFEVSQSSTWINLTISDTQKSDEGIYTCCVSERSNGSRSCVNTTLVVKERELSTMILKGEEQRKNDTGIVETFSGGDKTVAEPSLWLLLSITAVLILFVAIVTVIAIRRSRRREGTTENIHRPSDRTSHVYEDVDEVLNPLAQRSLPRLPDTYVTARPQPQPQTQTHYLQHFLAMRKPLFTPAPSVSSMSTKSGYSSEGPYDNDMYLRPLSSHQGDQKAANMTHNNMKYIAVLPTYSQLHRPTDVNKYYQPVLQH